MKAVVYSQTGGPEVLRLVEIPDPEPGPGEVLVRVAFSGVNPTDWKNRRGSRPGEPTQFDQQIPNQDGSGQVIAVGEGVPSSRVGERVWLWEAAYQRAGGTAAELVAIPGRQAVRLPDGVGLELGASLAIPAITAHRALTLADEGPPQLSPGALAGRTVLVAGGAGAVGHAAIELSVWAGARVITTVSTPEKGELARRAGAEAVVNYREPEAAQRIRQLAPEGVDLVVEVAPAANAPLDQAVLRLGGTVAA